MGIISSSEPASVSRRQNSYKVPMPSVPESLRRTGWRPPGSLEGRYRKSSVPISYTSAGDSLSSDLGPCHPISLAFFGQYVYVYHKGHRQAERAVCNLS